MRLTREKVNLLSHQITEKLASIDEVEFIEDRNTIRLAVVDIFMKWLKKEEEVDRAARQKIESQKRTIPEGSGEWEILYRKYYEEECETSWSSVATAPSPKRENEMLSIPCDSRFKAICEARVGRSNDYRSDGRPGLRHSPDPAR